MATPSTVDFESLLQPLAKPESSPDACRAAVRVARDAARTAEKQCLEFERYGPPFEGAPVPDPPDWEGVTRQACSALAEESKDLWIVAWLIEALTRTHGFAGLRDGFRLARELIEMHWEMLEPRPDSEDGIERTVQMLANLNGSVLVEPINAIPLTLTEDQEQVLTSGTFREIQQSDRQQLAAVTPVEFFQPLVEDIEAASQEFAQLCETLEERCGTDESGYSLAPPSSEIRAALEECRGRALSLYGERLPNAVPEQTHLQQPADLPTATGASPLPTGGQHVSTREEAFRVLESVAEFFRHTEPHSPIADKLEQTVRWGRMPWKALMNELVPDETLRKEIFRRVGIRDGDTPSD
jgi:type VI secretion system protein ImpA